MTLKERIEASASVKRAWRWVIHHGKESKFHYHRAEKACTPKAL